MHLTSLPYPVSFCANLRETRAQLIITALSHLNCLPFSVPFLSFLLLSTHSRRLTWSLQSPTQETKQFLGSDRLANVSRALGGKNHQGVSGHLLVH